MLYCIVQCFVVWGSGCENFFMSCHILLKCVVWFGKNKRKREVDNVVCCSEVW